MYLFTYQQIIIRQTYYFSTFSKILSDFIYKWFSVLVIENLNGDINAFMHALNFISSFFCGIVEVHRELIVFKIYME